MQNTIAQPNRYALYLAGLALASAGVYDIVASFIGEGYIGVPILLSIFALVLNFDYIKDTIKRNGFGAKWALIPLLIIWLSCIGHLDITTIAYGTWFVAVYFLGRSLNKRVFDIIPYCAILVSVFAIVSKITLYALGLYRNELNSPLFYLWQPHHDMAFLILMGMIFARGKVKGYMWALGVPALILGGSQEGLVILVALLIVWLLQKRKKLALVPICGLVAFVALSGYGQASFYDFGAERFSSWDSLLHSRVEPIRNLFQSNNWIWGTGWDFNFQGGTRAIHNTVLDMASNIGIIAGLAWLFAMIIGLFKTPYKWAFLTLIWFGMIDHSLWTELAIWSPMILGIATQKEAYNVT